MEDDLVTSTLQHRRFAFDTVFDRAGDVTYAPPRPKTSFTAEEMEAAKAQAYALGERSAVAQAEQQAAAALAQIAADTQLALGVLANAAHEHRTGAAELALVAARKIADAALDAFPEAVVEEALTALAREIEQQPRLVVRTSPELAGRLQASLDRMADNIGFTGHVVAKADHTLPGAAFVIDWGDGRAAFDPQEAAARVAAAIDAALAAEGLHGEPLLPGLTGDY